MIHGLYTVREDISSDWEQVQCAASSLRNRLRSQALERQVDPAGSLEANLNNNNNIQDDPSFL